jgi:rubrerythrin
MAVNYTAIEIFEIAEQIEQNGAQYYRAAASATKNKAVADILLTLAAVEDKHKKIFSEMLENYKNSMEDTNVFDPDNETLYYMKGIALNSGWEGREALKLSLSGKETPAEILKAAISGEQTSINFYLGMKELVKSPADKEKIEQIIKEEMSHIVYLQKSLETIK